ncbi:HpcH/HpaI aldolase/citrate lyase family protein [Streptomyces sp. NPDC056653]|uniref:HpcH/HpaI aldolase family protein n=1 Tax=Streptomyces sp. NPDC056653 TaxID=3345894 RepID=UPI0036A6C456
MRDNRTKMRMSSGRPALGVSLTIADAFVAEAIGAGDFDFVLIDTEHAPISIDVLHTMLVALRASASTVLVRPSANDATLIGQILDLGAEGVVVPGVRDAVQCAAAVSATRYPPAGVRGFGPRRAARLDGGRPEYVARADKEIAAFVMIEHAEAVSHIDAILETPGLDGIMVGPADLAVSMGHLHDLNHPAVKAATDKVAAACERHSVPFGIFAAAEASARRWVRRGARFVAVGADTQFLDQGIARTKSLIAELSPAD